MNKNEFIKELARRTGCEISDIRMVLRTYAGIISEKLRQEEDVDVPFIGKYYVTHRKHREYNNLFGGKTIDKSVRYPGFTFTKVIKDIFKP